MQGYKGPITRINPAKESIVLATLGFDPKRPWSVKTNYSYIPKPTEEESKSKEALLRKELFESLDTRNNPVIVFYGEGCARSEYTREYLERKKYLLIIYKLIKMNISKRSRLR